MRLVELFQAHPPVVDFRHYIRSGTDLPSGMPPLDVEHLKLETCVGDARSRVRTVVTDGDAALLVRYKGAEGAALGMREEKDGDEWRVLTVSGANSRKAYRVATGLRWQQLLGHAVRERAIHPRAHVRRITMPTTSAIAQVDGAAASERLDRHYELVRLALEMRYSAAERLFVAEIPR